ncbi:hypothetical protein EDC96DRAFT_576476 [Choanephora cucurbitarum]|nr:hypothetical protein EDC96DRAFT_576476 [Choanephora cucurbitarum]
MPILDTFCHSPRSIWYKILQLLQSDQQFSTPTDEIKTSSLGRAKYKRRRSAMDCPQAIPNAIVIPPFSPTYCKPNEFPYSNFYVKLPNGNWMVRYRSGNRKILGTDELEGYLI